MHTPRLWLTAACVALVALLEPRPRGVDGAAQPDDWQRGEREGGGVEEGEGDLYSEGEEEATNRRKAEAAAAAAAAAVAVAAAAAAAACTRHGGRRWRRRE